MNNFFLLTLVLLALVLGIVIGEGYAPLSRRTVYMLRDASETTATRLSAIERRCDRIEAEVEKLREIVAPEPASR